MIDSKKFRAAVIRDLSDNGIYGDKAAPILAFRTKYPSDNPSMKAAASAKCSRAFCQLLAEACQNSPIQDVINLCQEGIDGTHWSSDWHKAFRKMLELCVAIRDKKTVKPFAGIFGKGNGKLPFVTFSTLPGVTCPGAGECLQFCYSFRAWRYPAAFARQCQNTLLVRFAKTAIRSAFCSLPDGITFRLYVDGDFDSAATVGFWFRLLEFRSDIRCYGYSKSWDILRQFDGIVPVNYVLNLSSGSIYETDKAMRQAMIDVKRKDGSYMVRGDFVAIDMSQARSKLSKDPSKNTEYHRELRATAKSQGLGNVISCPIKCGDCGHGNHHCGNDKFCGADNRKLVTIAIGIH